jgi:S1-C subfamily serine protease
MRRFVAFCLLPALSLTWPSSSQGEAKDLEQALALQKVMQKVIVEAEPSIACILVSRSEAYGRLARQPREPDLTGKLGDFDPRELAFLGKRRKLDLADPEYVPEAFGSGVVIDPQGLVLTNYHVIRDATKIFLRLPGAKASYADIHAADPRSDLAVLRIGDARLLPLKAVRFGDAAKVERGQFVLTLANPFAVGFRDGQPSASWGIISNLRRRIPGEPREENRRRPLYYYGTLLQTDTRLSLGCSGGALLNLAGELIGLTTSLAAIHGGEMPGGFALPLDAGMRRILDVLKRGEEIEYGFLGIAVNEPRAAPGEGVEVGYVYPGSPADQQAHLGKNDVILAVNGVPLRESDDLFLHLGTQLVGTKIKLRIRHRGSTEIRTVDVTLGKFYVTGKKIASSLGNRPFFRGLRVDYTTLLVQQEPRLTFVPAGVLVSEVHTGTAAAQAKLKPGEVITHVNNRPVTSPAAFYQAVAALAGPIDLQLHTFSSHEPASKVTLK